MRIFGFLLIFGTKINKNSAKICLLFRRKGVLPSVADSDGETHNMLRRLDLARGCENENGCPTDEEKNSMTVAIVVVISFLIIACVGFRIYRRSQN